MNEIPKNNIKEKSTSRKILEVFFNKKEIKEMERRGWIEKYIEVKNKTNKLIETKENNKIKEINNTKIKVSKLFEEINKTISVNNIKKEYTEKLNKDGINQKKSKTIEKKDNIEKKTEGLILGKISKNKGIIQLLDDKGINYYKIKDNLKYTDISGFNRKYNETNIAVGSELKYRKIGAKNILEIKPPLLVKKEQFEKEKIPGTNELVINIINEECKKQGIEPELYMSLIGTESAFGTNLRSSTGYIGYSMLRKDTSLKQLVKMGSITKKEAIKAIKNNGKTKENIIAGIKYIAYLFKQFKGYNDINKIVLAAYNGGETKIKKICEKSGIPKNKITFRQIKKSNKLSNETKKYPYKILAIAKNFYNKNIT